MDTIKSEEILKKLKSFEDRKYGDFQQKLIPGVESRAVIGVRTPDLRKYAKELIKNYDVSAFLKKLAWKSLKSFFPSLITGLPVTRCLRRYLKSIRRNYL